MTTKLQKAIDNNDFQEVKWAAFPGERNYIAFGNERDEKDHGLPIVWLRNAQVNLPWLDENKDRIIGSVWDLPKFNDKAIVLVGASPVLKEQWKDLREAQENEHFAIASVNSAAQFLIERDVIPDYVVAIDGLYSGEWTLNLGDKAKDCIGLFSPFVHSRVLREWPGKIQIIPYTWKGKKFKKITDKVYRRWGKSVSAGGNAFNALLGVFVSCTEAEIFIFAGNELSFKENYYVHGKSTNDDIPHYKSRDINGNTVWTMNTLYTYKLWLDRQTDFLCSEHVPKSYVFINASGGIVGVDVDGSLMPQIKQMPLKDAIDTVKSGFEFASLPWEEKNKVVYQAFYNQGLYGVDGGHRKWKYFVDELLPEPCKTLDIGCGNGRGIRYALDNGYDAYGADVADVSTLWKQMNIEDRCRQAPAGNLPFNDDEFPLIVATELLEHIPVEGVDDVLNEMFRVGSDKFLFTISLTQSRIRNTFIHLAVQPPEWWMEKIRNAGFIVMKVMRMKTEYFETDGSGCSSFVVYAVKDEKPYLFEDRLLVREGWTDDVTWSCVRDEDYYYPVEVEDDENRVSAV